MERADFEKLRQILLENEQKVISNTSEKVVSLETQLEAITQRLNDLKDNYHDINYELQNIELLAEKINPLLDKRIKRLKNEFEYTFGSEVRDTVKNEITNAPEYLAEALSPLIGKVVVQYVNENMKAMFEYLKDIVTQMIENTKNAIGIPNNISIPAQETPQNAEIQEIFLIQNQTGLLMGSYSQNQITDLDLVAAMLTAIISFSKDVFNTDTEVKVIELKDYKILIEKETDYYAGIVLKGDLNEPLKIQLYHFLQEFYKQHIPPHIVNIDNRLFAEISTKLKQFYKKHYKELT